MVNKKRQVKNRGGSVKGEQGKQNTQRKEGLFSEESHQRSRVSQEPNEEQENVQDSGSRSRSGKMLRREPNSPVDFMMSPECMETFKKAGWLGYLQCLRGYHTEVSLAFARSFDGHETTIGVVTLFVSEVSIAELGQLQLGGKRFTKKDKIDEQATNKFLRPEFHNPNWSKGIETRFLKSEYLPWLNAIKLYITCDGRYDHMFRYQVWFLMHLAGEIKINFPYFLLQSLTKMSKKIQKFPALAESSLLHQSLITMLVNDALDSHNLTFSEFLSKSDFSPQSPSKKKKSEKGESSKGVSTETIKKEIKKPAVISGVDPGFKSEKPEVKVIYTRRSPRAQKGKNESAEDKQVQSEKNIKKPSVRTRPTNKFRLKGKMLMNPKIKNDEVIIINSDQSPSEDHTDEPNKKRKVISDDEVSEKLQKVSVHKRKFKKKVKAKSSSEKVQTNDSEKPFETSSNLQGTKGKEIYIEDLAKEIKQVETEEKIEENEKSLKQKVKEWMMLLDQEKSKDKEGKAARIYRKLIDMGHLTEELTWIVDNAVNTDMQAKINEVKKCKKAE